MERHILNVYYKLIKVLKWEIVPSTINTWLNWYTCQWDLFVDTFPNIREIFKDNDKMPIFFKKPDELAYHIYREVTQLIDLCVLDYISLKYNNRKLVASAIFITLCINLEVEYFQKEININNVDLTFWKDFLEEVNWSYSYIIDTFSIFLTQSFNFKFYDILNELVYMSKFLNFNFTYELPLILQNNSESENVNLS
jgi:hypothetical protein